MSSRHFFQDPTAAVMASLRALTLTNPSLRFDETNRIVYRHPASVADSARKVSLVCGGGSGHEPAYVGYVGRGLLTACVAGTIFASPGAEQVRACLARRLPRDTAGILVIVMNYTGDVLNFGNGAEKARAEGRDVELIVVGDDVGVGRQRGGKVGRRGIAGATLAVKACGALAETGASLQQVAAVGRLVADNVVSVAASLSRVHVLGRPPADAEDEARRLPAGHVEIGMGIHNEPGCEQVETDLPGAVSKMLSQLLDQGDADRAFVKFDPEADHAADHADGWVLMINNFGGLSNLELGAITHEVWLQLRRDWRITPVRVFAGVYNGSLNGLGFGVSLLRLADTGLGPGRSMLDLVDAPAECIGWPQPIDVATWEKHASLEEDDEKEQPEEPTKPSNLRIDHAKMAKVLTGGLKRVIAVEPEVTRFDTIVGDGDCGTGLKRGAEAVLAALDASAKDPNSSDLLVALAPILRAVETTMDGTSGALFAIFLNALASSLRLEQSSPPSDDQGDAGATKEQKKDADASVWAAALRNSLDVLQRYTPAKPGDRTLMDALFPFVDTLERTRDLRAAGDAAIRGAETTRGMKPGLGRTVYVGGTAWQDVPDPGAYGLAEFLKGLGDESQ